MTVSSPYILEALKINKRFASLQALEDVSLKLRRGSFHALLGENGAGKSTLVKCIMGYYQPDTGEVIFGDKQQSIRNPHEAMLLGIGMVYQHFTLIQNMTVAENIILSRPELPSIIHWKSELAALQERMQSMPFNIPLHALVSKLSAGEKQKVEIIKQLLLDTKVLILDEPTSVLTPNEADEVLGQIKSLTKERQLSVLTITHKFREVTEYADEVTVLRKGKFIGTKPIASVTMPQLAEMMVGHEVTNTPVDRAPMPQANAIFTINELKVNDDSGVPALKGLSVAVQPGEIVGIAGVSGNGQRELVQVLAGQREKTAGAIYVNNEEYTATRKQMQKFKLHCLPEEPLRNASVASMSVANNLVFRTFDKPVFTFSRFIVKHKSILANAKQLIKQYNIKTPTPSNPIGNLSGGNVQRTVLARELSEDVDILIVSNPCFGLDFNAVDDIHKQLVDARNNGTAVLLLSEDLDEILELSDRLLVISDGKLVYETTPDQAQLSTIGGYMAGH